MCLLHNPLQRSYLKFKGMVINYFNIQVDKHFVYPSKNMDITDINVNI